MAQIRTSPEITSPVTLRAIWHLDNGVAILQDR
jgi:hypothetical protein